MTDDSQDLTRQFLFHVAKISLEKAFSEFDMPTGIEIGGAIKSLSAAVSLAKTVMEVAKKVDNVELIRAIAELNLEMANANLGIAETTNQLTELKQENGQLRKKIWELEETSKKENKLIFKDGCYIKSNGEGPFCPNCYNKNESKSFLKKEGFGYGSQLFNYKCVTCHWEKEAVDESDSNFGT